MAADSGLAPTAMEVRRTLSDAEISAVGEVMGAAASVDDRAGIDDPGWKQLVREGRPDFTAVRTTDGHGYAQASRPDPARSWVVDYAVHPAHRQPDGQPAIDLLRTAFRVIADAGGGPVSLWVSQPRAADERVAAGAGLGAGRVLYQMRRPLPVEDEIAGRSEALTTRPFRPGEDDRAWLEVNNRAFAWHPEQGGWTVADLEQRVREPWFDPDCFLLHEQDGRLAGFCWTKVHTDHTPVLGEIYVIATDPDFAGRGLGRRLSLAGLAHLSALGVPVGMLYVDAGNTGAVKLYVDLGFVVHHVDQVFTAEMAPADQGTA